MRTEDLQEVSVPGTLTYRFAQPEIAAGRIDFSVDPLNGAWLQRPLETVGSMLYGAAAAAVAGALTGSTLASALAVDLADLGRRVELVLAADERLTSIGVAVVGVRFALMRPEPDVEKALQTPAREGIQQDADRAVFERRALAVEREAAIGENELANQIELARRQEQLIARKGANARRQAEEASAADAIATETEAARTTSIAQARAVADRAVGEAAADNERARLAAYDEVSRDVLLALAVRELAQNLPRVDHLVVTPDLVTGLLSRFAAADVVAGK